MPDFVCVVLLKRAKARAPALTSRKCEVQASKSGKIKGNQTDSNLKSDGWRVSGGGKGWGIPFLGMFAVGKVCRLPVGDTAGCQPALRPRVPISTEDAA